MPEKLTPTQMELKTRALNSSASVRLTRQGEPLFPKEKTRKNRTAVQAFALSIGDPSLYEEYFDARPRPEFPDSQGFTSVLTVAPERHSTELTREAIKAMITKHIDTAAKKTTAIFTPFMSGLQQIRVGQFVQNTIADIQNALATDSADSGIEILATPQPAEVINSVTRVFLYPSTTPVNKANDFDPGNCDLHLNSSFRRGDRGLIGARTNGFVFFVSAFGSSGWVDERHVDTEVQTENALREVFYTGGSPLFISVDGEGHSILPGDSLYTDGATYMVKVRNKAGDIKTHHIALESEGLRAENVTPGFDFSERKGWDDAISFLTNLDLPYMWSVFDCSEVLRRMLLMGGITVSKYSGDMMNDLKEITPLQATIATAEELDALPNGIYTINLIMADGGSGHMYFVVKNGNDLAAFSYAFDIQADAPKVVDNAIGPHFCGKEALKLQLAKGRKLVASQLAS
jgi:hypothetical protein